MTTATALFVSPNGFGAAVTRSQAHEARRAAVWAHANRICDRMVYENDGYFAQWFMDYALAEAERLHDQPEEPAYYEAGELLARTQRTQEYAECPF